MSVMAPEEVVLNFPNWLDHQDTGTQEWVNAYVDQMPPEERDAAREQYSNMSAVAQAWGADLGDVEANWPLLRDGYAEAQNDSNWTAAMGDEHAFHEQLAKQYSQQQQERYLLKGLDDDQAPGAVEAWQGSLLNRVAQAAIAQKPYAEALSDWTAANVNNPGYNAAHADQYAQVAADEYDRMQPVLSRVRPAAEDAFHQIARARGVEPGTGDSAPVAAFRGLSDDEIELAFQIMTHMAASAPATKKTWYQALGEAVGRSFENLGLGGGAAAYRDQLLQSHFTAGQQVHSNNPRDEVNGAYSAYMVSRSGANSAIPSFYLQPTHNLSAEEASQWNQQVDGMRKEVDLGERFRKYGQQVIDPTDQAGGWFFKKFVLPAADSSATMVAFAQPELWAPALEAQARQFQNDDYLTLREGDVSPQEASRIGLVTGTINAGVGALESYALKGIGGRIFPQTTRLLRNYALTGSTLGRIGLETAKGTATATAVSLLQNEIIPAVVHDAMTSNPALHKDWGQIWKETWEQLPDAAMGSILLAAGGAALEAPGQKERTAYVEALSNDRAAMRLAGYTPEQIGEIQSRGSLAEREELLQKYAGQEPPPPGPERDALMAYAKNSIAAQRAALREKLNLERGVASDAADAATKIVRDGDGWTVHFGDKTMQVNSAEAASRIRDDLMMAASQKEAESLVALIDHWHDHAPEDTTRKTTLTGEEAQSDGDSIQYFRNGQVTCEVMSPEALAELRKEAALGARNSGNEPIDVAVNGANVVDFQNKTADGAGKLAQGLEINHSPSAVLTFLHERVEADYQRALKLGVITPEEVHAAVRELAKHYDPAQARTAGERELRENIQKLAAGELDPTALREVMSELAVADAMGRRRDGSAVPAGSISAALFRAGAKAPDAAVTRAVGKVRAFLRSMQENFRALFGTMAALKKARREGSAAGFDEIIRKVTNGDAEAGARMAGEANGGMGSGGEAGVGFSLRKREGETRDSEKGKTSGAGKKQNGGTGSKVKLGGSHKEMSRPKRDKLDSHHMPASAAIKASNLTRDEGGAIKMPPRDHRRTGSWGRSKAAQAYRAKQTLLIQQEKFHEAKQMDINDLKAKFGDRYAPHIKQWQAYIKSLPPEKLLPKRKRSK